MVWTRRQVINRLRPRRHTASTPRRSADQLDTSPLWFWDDEPPTTPRADTRTLPIIIDQDRDPYPLVERGLRTRPPRTWWRGASLGAAAAAAVVVLLFSGGSLPGTGPKAGGHHGHPAPGGAQPGPGLRAAPTPP